MASIGLYGKTLLGKMGLGETAGSLPGGESGEDGVLRVERRREARSPKISPCSYGLMRSVDRDGVTLEEGLGTAVNESPTGLRLLLGIAPHAGQLLELQTTDSKFRYGLYLAEVCWTKPLREDEQGALYLVGCRVNFGTSHVSLF
ncbi:hypothetical protein ACO9S2_05175 [Nitrospira sp. NS4]|uniref:hypothetical protein n=1 Tax=Nitrospira sp. NS4 TaxID=3414498 RepID=UPI003C2C9AB0